MCLSPIQKKSNRKYFLPGRWQSYYNEFPCGQCAECRQNRELDDYIRTLWEAKYVFNVCHGYGLFETLSYDPKHLPHVIDVCKDLGINLRCDLPKQYNLSCFRLADWRSFITNLNADIVYYIKKQLKVQVEVMFNKTLTMRQLHKTWKIWFEKVYGFKCPKHLFNYIMASEFGHDDEYIDDRGNMRKGTKRPHYHVIFFSYLPEYVISPENFSRAINNSWHRGRTDGVDWPNKWHRNQRDWREKRVFTTMVDNTININILNVLSYIAKYIHKDVDMTDKFGSIEDKIFECIYPYYYEDYWKMLSGDYEGYKLWKRFKRNIFNFSKKGHDYGVYYAEWLKSDEGKDELDKICNDGYISLPLNKDQKVYRHSLPSYYANKLFKEPYRNKDGKKRWRPNELGLSVKKRQIELSIHNMVRKYREFLVNACVNLSKEDIGKLNDILSKQKGDEGLQKFLVFVARWYRLYEGRLMDQYVERTDFVNVDLRSLPRWFEMIDIIVENMRIESDDDMDRKIKSGVGKSFTYEGKPIIFNYQSNSDVAHFGKSFLTNVNLGNKDDGWFVSRNVGWQMNDNRYYPFDKTSNDKFEIHDSTFYGCMNALTASHVKGLEDVVEFKKLFDKYRWSLDTDKQEVEDFKDELIRHYKDVGIL